MPITYQVEKGQPQDLKVIKGATLIDGTSRRPIQDTVIIIQGDRIKEISSKRVYSPIRGAEVTDARGMFVIAGLADMHNHLAKGGFLQPDPAPDYKSNLRELLGWGFTTVFDPGIGDMAKFAELKRAAADDPSYPHFYCVGRFLTVKNGHGSAEGGLT
ncbi:MAG TPA: hypothetical protein VI756_20040, partial [Blastocatellia bacterium]